MRPVGPSRSGARFHGALVSAVQQRADVVAAHQAVGDGDVFGGARVAQRVAALEHDGVVVRRVDAAVGDAHVAAAVDIDAVAIGVDLEVVDGQIIHAGGQDAEVSAVENREIAQRHVARESLSAMALSPTPRALAGTSALAGDQAGALRS